MCIFINFWKRSPPPSESLRLIIKKYSQSKIWCIKFEGGWGEYSRHKHFQCKILAIYIEFCSDIGYFQQWVTKLSVMWFINIYSVNSGDFLSHNHPYYIYIYLFSCWYTAVSYMLFAYIYTHTHGAEMNLWYQHDWLK